MPLISKALRMNGQSITTPAQFREYFSPGDFLRSKELAAYFAIRHLEQLSPAHTYFSDLLNIAVIRRTSCCDPCSLPCEQCILSACFVPDKDGKGAEQCELFQRLYGSRCKRIQFSGHWNFDRETGYEGWTPQDNEALMTSLTQDPFRLKVNRQVYSIAMNTGLPDRQKGFLTLILSLGYLLAGWLPEERPICPAEAEAALLGKPWTPEITFRDAPEGRIYPARPEPYRLSLRESTSLFLGETITLRKLIAEASPQGNTAMAVVFQLPDGRQETVMPGDYRYASFVGEEMIRLYPVEKRNGDRILLRRGNTLYLKDGSGTTLQEIPCREQDIVDMVPALYNNEYILLTPDRVDYRGFHNNDLPSWGIVELQMKGNTVYQLTDRGELRQHGDWTTIPRRTTMDGMTL